MAATQCVMRHNTPLMSPREYFRKASYLIAFLCLCITNVHAQSITKLEYFIDTDPGFGNGTTVSVSAATDVTANFTVDINSIQPGFHNLYVRGFIPPYTVSENGSPVTKGGWSLTAIRNLYKETF